MKPDWKDAPKWANWLAMDGNGGWYWHERRPQNTESWCWIPTGRITPVGELPGWQETLEGRPKPEPRYVFEYDPRYNRCWKVTDTKVGGRWWFSTLRDAETAAKALNKLEDETLQVLAEQDVSS